MQNLAKLNSIWARVLILALFCSALVISPARADVAPPESPPGVIISPGTDSTQVRMLSEVVTLTIGSSADLIGKAKTSAVFIMRNLGSADENIDVRFPLTYGDALYYDNKYPEINDFNVQVGDSSVPTSRITSVDAASGKTIPWASFTVKFPVGQDVKINATYTAQGFGYEPFQTYRYILKTGAGWKDTIGDGDIIVQLPYPANQQNILIDAHREPSQVNNMPVFSGNDARWHFEDLEPTAADNFQVDLVMPAYWQKILAERDNTSKNPQDGEAWGQLGKAIKKVLFFSKGIREDDGANQLYPEAVQAYEKSVSLLPNDALWHYGFADLLWSHYLFGVSYSGSQDYSELTRLESELQRSLQIDPTNKDVQNLASWISGTFPWALSQTGSGYDYLALTATPTLLPDTAVPSLEAPSDIDATATAFAELPTIGIEETDTPAGAEPAATDLPAATAAPTGGNPLCGSILVFPALLGLLWFVSKKH